MSIGERVSIVFGINVGILAFAVRDVLSANGVDDPRRVFEALDVLEVVLVKGGTRDAAGSWNFEPAKVHTRIVLDAFNRELESGSNNASGLSLRAFRAMLSETWHCLSDRWDRSAKKTSISTPRKGYSMFGRRHNVQFEEGSASWASPTRACVEAYDPDVRAFCQSAGWKTCLCSRRCVFFLSSGRRRNSANQRQTSMTEFLS